MKRDLARLSRETFDLVVVGGGISGACIAWDGALRGLRVAVVEKSDFGHATSSASSKIIHGGIRYLQQGLPNRVVQSARERTTFLRIAPHLVHPVPFLVPTYGHGLRGKELLTVGMSVYDLLTLDRRRVDDPARRIPRVRFLSTGETLEIVPDVPRKDLTGAVVYHDAQMTSSERTTLAFLRSAARRGAAVANYVEARGVRMEGGRVAALSLRDLLGGDAFEVRARVVVSAAGPWVFRFGADGAMARHRDAMAFSKGIHVLTRRIHPTHALALATRLPNEAIINRGGRHIFLIPWRGHTLIGTTNVPFAGPPEALAVTEKDVRDFLVEINHSWPAAGLRREDVRFAYGGLYQLYGARLREGIFQSASAYRLFDHRVLDGIDGLVTALGARFTTARRLAAECVDLVFRKLDRLPPPCATDTTRLDGGEMERIEPFVEEAVRRHGPALGEAALRELLDAYGTRYEEVIALGAEDAALLGPVAPERPLPRAAVVHAVREEMAQTLGDVVFRRTGIGTVGDPGEAPLRDCASLVARELGWSEDRTASEVRSVREAFSVSP